MSIVKSLAFFLGQHVFIISPSYIDKVKTEGPNSGSTQVAQARPERH